MHFTVNEKLAGSTPAVKTLNGYLFVLFFGFFFLSRFDAVLFGDKE